VEYAGRIRCKTIPLAGLLPNEIVLFTSHAAGKLRFLASSSDTSCHRIGGNLHPPLQDIRECAAVGASVSILLRAASLREELKPPGGVLLLA
jgi:hypothetical protein